MASLSPSEISYQESHVGENRSVEIITASAICLTAAYVAVVLRFVSRRLSKTALEGDDYTIMIALVSICRRVHVICPL